jgi:hypothetical protein
MYDLKPCPFCGAMPEIFRSDNDDDDKFSRYDIRCNTIDCYLEDGADWTLPKDELVSMWNRRKAYQTDIHMSDCATHNGPAYPAGECNCRRAK